MLVKKYISQLLETNDCVIVPGFGAFIKHYESASIHPITHKFTPPYQSIGFNSRLVLNDNLLMKHITVGEGCTDTQAMHQIQLFTHSLKQHINQFGFFEFEHIGRFFLNQEGKLQFDPEPADHFSEDTFGLKEFIVQPIDRTPYTMSTNYAKNTSSKKGDESANKSSSSKKLLIIIPAVLLVCLGGLFVYMQQTDYSIAGVDVMELLGLRESKAVVQPVETDSTTVSEYDYESAEAVEETPAEYCVILGSFMNNALAQKYSDKLNRKGMSTTVMEGDNGYYRVGISGIEEKEAALNKRNELIPRYGSTIWVMKK